MFSADRTLRTELDDLRRMIEDVRFGLRGLEVRFRNFEREVGRFADEFDAVAKRGEFKPMC